MQGICRRNFLSRTSDDYVAANADQDNQKYENEDEDEDVDEGEDEDEVEDNYARSTRVHTNGNVGKHFKSQNGTRNW